MMRVPLKLEFPSLYNICADKSCLVADCWAGDGWKVSFKRSLGVEDMEEWDRLMDVLDHSLLQNNGLEDNHNWVFEKSEVY